MSATVVTGGTGVVGRALVAALRARGDRVVVLARGAEADVRADVADAGAVARAVEGAAVVFHLAVPGTATVLGACAAAGTRVVVASSVEVYGPRDGALTEDLALAPASPYAREKADADVLAREQGAIVARLTNVYGPGDRRASRLVPELLDAARHGHPPRLRSDGTPRRDFLHADDAARALIALAQDGGAGEAYNIGSGVATSVSEVVEALERVLGRSLHATYEGAGDGAHWTDTTKIARATGWRPEIGLEDGLRRLAAVALAA